MDLQPFSVKLISLSYFTSFTAGVHAHAVLVEVRQGCQIPVAEAVVLVSFVTSWMGGTELGSSGRAVMALKGSAISLALAVPLLEATL